MVALHQHNTQYSKTMALIYSSPFPTYELDYNGVVIETYGSIPIHHNLVHCTRYDVYIDKNRDIVLQNEQEDAFAAKLEMKGENYFRIRLSIDRVAISVLVVNPKQLDSCYLAILN